MPLYNFGSKSELPGPSHFLQSAPDNRSDVERVNGLLSVYDTDSPEILTARTNVEEQINISGADVKVYPRTDNADFDLVWEEDPDPTYLNHFRTKAFFKPANLKIELKKWGIDTVAPTEIVFSHRRIFQELGERMLRAGDVIYIPYNAAAINPTHYRVTNGAPSGNYRYVWMYFTCQTVILKADTTVRPQDDIQDRNQAEPGGVGFRESY